MVCAYSDFLLQGVKCPPHALIIDRYLPLSTRIANSSACL